MDNKEEDCDYCRNTGTSYYSDGVYGDCLHCFRGGKNWKEEEVELNKLLPTEKLKLYKFIHKKFWTMNMKELHEMEEEYGEERLIDCFNELMRPLTKHING